MRRCPSSLHPACDLHTVLQAAVCMPAAQLVVTASLCCPWPVQAALMRAFAGERAGVEELAELDDMTEEQVEHIIREMRN